MRRLLPVSNPRDIPRLTVGALLTCMGGYRLVVILYATVAAYGSLTVVFDRMAVQFLGVVLLALAALGAGVGIVLRRARGSCALLCGVGIVSETFQIYTALGQRYIATLGIYLIVFLLGFFYLLLPQRRSIASIAAPGKPEAPQILNDSNWREWLLASLRDTGVEAPHDRFHHAAGAFLGYLVFAGTIVVGSRAVPPEPILLIVWVVFGIAVLSRFRNSFLRQFWQARAHSADEELQQAGSRRPVLYLRSFALDAKLAAPSLMERFLGTIPLADTEQVLTKELHRCGPVIAIGRPGEALPALGAARFYVTNERWKEKVADIIRVAELVVWATGTTEGLHWEISHLIESLPPEKLVLWAHPHLMRVSQGAREEEWTRFREMLGSAFPRPLPERLGEARFFYFTAQFEPVPIAPAVGWNALRSALRALLRAQGYPKPVPIADAPQRRRALIAMAAAAVVFAVMVAGAYTLGARQYARNVQATNDANAWNSLATDLKYAEEGADASGHLDKILARLREVPDEVNRDLSPALKAPVTEVAKDYTDIFVTAHDRPEVEPLLYRTNYTLILGVDSLDEAKKRRADIGAVLGAFAHFQRDWAHVRTVLSKDAATYSMGGFEKLTAARAQFLEGEASMLQFLIDHPEGWKLKEYQSGIHLPTYDDEAVEQEFIKTIAVRDDALQSLRPLLPK